MGHTRRQPPARQRTQPLLPPALTVAAPREIDTHPCALRTGPNAFSRCHGSRCWVSSQEHAGMVDLGANGDPGTR